MKFTNVELWNALRAKYKSFASITAEADNDIVLKSISRHSTRLKIFFVFISKNISFFNKLVLPEIILHYQKSKYTLQM